MICGGWLQLVGAIAAVEVEGRLDTVEPAVAVAIFDGVGHAGARAARTISVVPAACARGAAYGAAIAVIVIVLLAVPGVVADTIAELVWIR